MSSSRSRSCPPAPHPLARTAARRALVAAALLGLLAACGRPTPPAEPAPVAAPAKAAAPAGSAPLKVGFVYVSPVSEAGWTAQHNAGRLALEQALGGQVTTTYVDKVPEGADAERVIRDLAAQGHRLIFTTSFGFMNPTLKVAEEFPGTVFEHATGYRTAKNVGTYNARFYEGRYLAGIVAGKMTRTNTLGVVAAFPIPEVLQGINAFTLGARSVNPQVKTRVVWVNTWYDPGREREAAMALMDQGVDVVTHHTDSTATVAAAEERGKMAVAYHSDMRKFAPKAQIAAVTHHWGAYYIQTARKVIDGTWAPGMLWGGVREGMIRLEGLGAAVPADVRSLVATREAALNDGALHPFAGPLRRNDGSVVLEQGTMSDEALNRMNFYVDGVVGTVPASKP